MYRTFINLMIGAIVGMLSGMIVEHCDENIWKAFAFLWAAPILLFVPIYISYYKSNTYIRSFLYNALLGASLSVFLILLTLALLNINKILALTLNFVLSLLAIYLYFNPSYLVSFRAPRFSNIP